MDKNKTKIGVIGGGASGLLFSYLVKKLVPSTVEVCIFEKNDKVGKKILATGNGKCNLSNANLGAGLYNCRFAEDIISKIDEKYVKNVFLELGIITKTDKEGRIYPYSLSANSVLDALYEANLNLNNKIITNHEVKDIKYENKMFYIDELAFDYLIMACGGKANTKNNNLIGEILTKFGHKWVADHPGLCSIETVDATASLNGIKVKANVSINNHNFDGEVLFKNNGLSGIAIFEASRYVKSGDIIHLDLMSEYDEATLAKLIPDLKTFNHTFPKMVAKDILARANNDLNKAIKIIKDYKFSVKKLASYENAQIMVGGIDTDDVKNSLESKLIPNLYILGEVLNVDGTCGGYNLHFAWASAIIASKNIADGLK
ncbi:MAG: aminoacetone oxidase family FAD-binding enzyme [Bacilli bacterium]|nr:aminoacetone oxidase family FAD-binding enzyme [Bacilli bacterium]